MAERRQYRSMRHLALDHVDFLSIFDCFDEGIIIVDDQGRIVYYNDTMSRIDDLKPDATVGRRVTEIYDLTVETSMIMRCLRAGEPIVNRTFFYRTRMGKVANTIHSVFPLIRDEKLIGAICFVKDYNLLEAGITSITPSSEKGEGDSSGAGYIFNDIVGHDPELLRCVNTAKMAANSPSPVMLCGETGTGKELFAQAIHNYSSRRKKRYIPINCAAIPENLLEGILFGTNRGAFTGALDRAGLFERASGGTLFLDEVNSMPIGLQAKILRVLQEKKVRRLGSLSEIDIDIKIISSVNREPHLDIEGSVLRPDLFYRLGVVFIRIPPLRERLSDIETLVAHFLEKIGHSLGTRVRRVEPRVMEVFAGYPWPGNIRELEHILEGAMNIAGRRESIAYRHLPAYFRNGRHPRAPGSDVEQRRRRTPFVAPSAGARRRPPKPPEAAVSSMRSLPDTRLGIERNMIVGALSDCRGNVTRAAAKLGISRQLLHYKMKKYGLLRRDFM